MSWVALDDLLGTIPLAPDHADLTAPVNVVTPQAATNADFAPTLAGRSAAPSSPLARVRPRLPFGEMGDALLLASTRVAPRRVWSR